VLVSKVEIDSTALFGDADKHCSFRRVKERAGFKQIKRGANRCRIGQRFRLPRNDSAATRPETCCRGAGGAPGRAAPELVAYLAAQRARLLMPEVMWVGWFAPADEAGLRGDVGKMPRL
jgi:hypothetical protein